MEVANQFVEELIDHLRNNDFAIVYEKSLQLPDVKSRQHFFSKARNGLIEHWENFGFTRPLALLLVDNEVFNIIQLQEAYTNAHLQTFARPYHFKQIRKILNEYTVSNTDERQFCSLFGKWLYCPKCGKLVAEHDKEG